MLSLNVTPARRADGWRLRRSRWRFVHGCRPDRWRHVADVRDWVSRFNALGPDGLFDRKAPGPASKLDNDQRRALANIVESGPIPAVHGVVRCPVRDLAQWIWEEFGVSSSETTISGELKVLGFRKLSARSLYYAQNEVAMEHFKRVSRPHWRPSGGSASRHEIELWWADQARIGQ